MIIKKALSNNVKALVKLENEVFNHVDFPLSRASFYYHVNRNLLLIACNENSIPIGYVLVLVRRKKAKLYSLCIDKSFRGNGVAVGLMQKVFVDLYELDFKKINLEVREDNHAAITLYKKLGFKVVNESPGFYRDGCNALIMEKDLAS